MDRAVSLTTKWGGLVAAKGIEAWMATLQYRALYYDQQLDLRFSGERPRIYVFWHEYILLPLYLRGHCDVAMLLSRHKDADVLARVALHSGIDCVRGSTKRGSTAALRELTRRGQHMHLTITPDGPRGPRRQLAVGPVYLASRLGLSIVPVGFGLDRPWRAKSWDRFAVPRPFSNARAVVGPELHVADGIDRAGLELARQDVERILTDLTLDAEDWAASGAHRVGEVCEHRRPRARRSRLEASASINQIAPLPFVRRMDDRAA